LPGISAPLPLRTFFFPHWRASLNMAIHNGQIQIQLKF
jgi:hypothetical protein